MWKKILIGLGAAIVLAAVVGVTLIGPRNLVGMARYDIRDEGSLRVGDRAPDVELVSLEGPRVHLKDRFGARPVVMIFGSFT
jgi:hypothetical protein